jgi:hypothetical protein
MQRLLCKGQRMKEQNGEFEECSWCIELNAVRGILKINHKKDPTALTVGSLY